MKTPGEITKVTTMMMMPQVQREHPKKAQIKKGLDHQAPHLLESQRKHPRRKKALLKAMKRDLPLPKKKLYCN